MAEKEGFEPSIPFWGIHDFQSCALGQLRDFSMWAFVASPVIIHHLSRFVNPYFSFFLQEFFCPTPGGMGQTGDLLQQPDPGFFAGVYRCLIPDAGLDLADVAAAHHQHGKTALTDTAADGQGQLVVQQHLMEG